MICFWVPWSHYVEIRVGRNIEPNFRRIFQTKKIPLPLPASALWRVSTYSNISMNICIPMGDANPVTNRAHRNTQILVKNGEMSPPTSSKVREGKMTAFRPYLSAMIPKIILCKSDEPLDFLFHFPNKGEGLKETRNILLKAVFMKVTHGKKIP